jgi:tRNA threonylcarbamoyladenosine biosynthesis protein TsaE
MKIQIISRSEEQTRSLGERIGRLLSGGDVVALEGGLGAGKTCLTQGIARGLGLSERDVVSPTYTLIHEISGKAGGETRGVDRLFHVDLYRIGDADDLENTGFYEAFEDDAVTVVEWADRFPGIFAVPYLQVILERTGETERTIRFVAHGRRHLELTQSLAKTSLDTA